jgi:DNA polymerase delta subunit 1
VPATLLPAVAFLQGEAPVDKQVLYADRAKFFPWRPRLWMAAYDIQMYAGLAQAAMLAWALLSPLTAGTQPVIWCELGRRAGTDDFGAGDAC